MSSIRKTKKKCNEIQKVFLRSILQWTKLKKDEYPNLTKSLIRVDRILIHKQKT